MGRFNKEDQLEINRARTVLRDPSTTLEAKSTAKKSIERIQTERNRRIEARRLAGTQPQRKNFESEEEYEVALQSYWARLDYAVAEREARKILSDPNTSSLVRRRAYERLGIEPPETTESDTEEQTPKGKKTDRGPMREDFGFRSGHDWDDFVKSGREEEFQAALAKWRETAPPLDPQLAALFGIKGEEE